MNKLNEFEEIPHSGGSITFSNGQSKYENRNPFPMILYEIVVSFNGIILSRGNFGRHPVPEPAVTVMIASDKEGLFGYSCPRCEKYFRANHHIPETIVCPYCLYIANALKFLTMNQKQYIDLYVKSSIEHFYTGKEIKIDFDELVSKLDNNLIKLHSYEQRQQMFVECKTCKIKIDIIGIYASCPGCGSRNNLHQFNQEIIAVKDKLNKSEIDTSMGLNKVIECYSGLGSDIKYILEKNIPLTQKNTKEAKSIDFQKIVETNSLLDKLYGLRLFPDEVTSQNFLNVMFQKRHLIAHRSSIVDQKYLDKTSDKSVKLGQKIMINRAELDKFINLMETYTEDFLVQFDSLVKDYIHKSKKL